jgi:branched-chain amino acid transport system ATP-binding protein
MMNSSLLSVEKVTMEFGGLRAVENIRFALSRGEILAIIGPNGAGKTTIFNLITGIYTPTSGDIFFMGKRINGITPDKVAKMGIRRTFQTSRLFNNLSILDNVLLGMVPIQKTTFFDSIIKRGTIKKELEENIYKSIELIGYFSEELKESLFRRSADLSQGDKRRVEICRALASDPKIVLLDEPSAGMDPDETRQLMDDIKKIKNKNVDIGIILIEHDMSVVRNIADHVIVLSYGKLISEGSFDAVSQDINVQEAYLGKGKKYS